MKEIIRKIPILNEISIHLYRKFKAIRGSRRLKNISSTRPIKIVIGASGTCDAGWVATDIDYMNVLNPAHWKTYFAPDSIDAIFAEHVWEHLTVDEGLLAAQYCFKYLKPGGFLRLAVPDGLHPSEEYLRSVEPGGTGDGADDHKVLYDNGSLAKLFEEAGFEVRLLEHFDAYGKFHSVDWDPADGKVIRSARFDHRNSDGQLNYTSIILDATKAE